MVPSIAAAGVPAHIPVQARLVDGDGTPIEAVTDVTFALYTQASGGSALSEETRSVDPNNGYFSVFIGQVTPLDWSLVDGSQPLFVGYSVDGADMGRQPVGTVPFAAYSDMAGYAIEAGNAQTVESLDVQGIVSEVATAYPSVTDPYLDADAVAAMGSVADGNALNHGRYTDAEAVAAMGPRSSNNDYNHARYTPGEAVTAMGSLADSNPLNHTRYSDADARSTIAAEDRYLRDTTDTLTGDLTVTNSIVVQNDVVVNDDAQVAGDVRFSGRLHDNDSFGAVHLIRMAFGRSTGANANRITFDDADGVGHSLDVPNTGVLTQNSHIVFIPATGSSDSQVVFNIDSSPTQGCVLVNNDNDVIRTPLSTATDGGNSFDQYWGEDGIKSFVISRPGVSGIPISSAESYMIICF